jgi:hypothetical protein
VDGDGGTGGGEGDARSEGLTFAPRDDGGFVRLLSCGSNTQLEMPNGQPIPSLWHFAGNTGDTTTKFLEDAEADDGES